MSRITPIDIQAYRDRLDRQLAVLPLSTIFSESEKENVKKCYEELIAICDKKILEQQPTTN